MEKRKYLNASIIVPFFNEENTLDMVARNLIDTMPNAEIVLVNDGSIDNSPSIAKALSHEFENIKLFSTNKNIGKGGAIKLGFEKSRSTYIGIFDADLEYSTKDLETIFEILEDQELDVVCGSRFIGNIKRNNLYRRTFIANKFLSFLFSILNGTKVTDVATCLKAFKRSVYEGINLESQGFNIEVELLAKLLKKTSNYSEVPINYSARSYSEGKKIKLKDGFKYIIAIFKYRFVD